MKLYYFPLSTYAQKTLIALYEKSVDFEPVLVNLQDETERTEYRKIYPLGKVPLLVRDDDWLIPESSIIIEYIDANFEAGPRLIPADGELARQTRFADRVNDLYLNDSITTLLFQSWKPEDQRDLERIETARFRAAVLYQYMDKSLEEKDWLVGDFSMADCAAAPALLYGEQVFPFAEHGNVAAYWDRLKARSSVQRTLAEARPYLDKLTQNAA